MVSKKIVLTWGIVFAFLALSGCKKNKRPFKPAHEKIIRIDDRNLIGAQAQK